MPVKHTLDLLATMGRAFKFFPPLYVNSILGHPPDWVPPYPQYSEFRILDPRKPVRALHYLIDAGLMPIPMKRPRWLGFVPEVFFLQEPHVMHWQGQMQDYDPHPDESWFFINGVTSNNDIAKLQRACLTHFFRRPMTIIQNPTDSIYLDILEAAVGKTGAWMAKPAHLGAVEIKRVLCSAKKKVVVVAYSQGSIIMANILRELQKCPDARAQLHKLEIYNFANCSDRMEYIDPVRRVPYIENFANRHDLVARLGVLAPQKRGIIRIDGPVFVNNRFGHLLNHHYLYDMLDERGQSQYHYDPRQSASDYGFEGEPFPRLFTYHKDYVGPTWEEMHEHAAMRLGA